MLDNRWPQVKHIVEVTDAPTHGHLVRVDVHDRLRYNLAGKADITRAAMFACRM